MIIVERHPVHGWMIVHVDKAGKRSLLTRHPSRADAMNHALKFDPEWQPPSESEAT